MIVGSSQVTLYLLGCQSLKDKRSVLQSVIKRTQNRFNVSIAEVGDQDLWQRATVGIAVVAVTARHANQQLQTVVEFIEREPRLEVGTVDTEIG